MATPRGSRPPGDSIRGSRPPADHPRPTMVRPHWALLEGRAGFAHDDQDVGLRQGWFREGRDAQAFDRTIRLPFPPESRASGIGDTGFHPVVWYRIAIPAGMLESLGHGPGRRLLVHFGAVDHDAIVWVDGTEAGSHQGGQSAFTLDITDCLGPGPDHHIVVRAHDDPTDRSQLRGKQDWQPRPHAIWYERSTGIWRPVWLESVPDTHISQLSWRVSLREGTAIALIELNHAPRRGVPVTVTLGLGGKPIAATRATLRERAGRIRVSIPHARRWAWSPANPQLLDATISAGDDRMTSYVGMRDVSVGTRRLEINGQPTYLRQVLEQCYWPDSLYTPPDVQALDDELALIAGLGFNGLRIHQQTPDPRLLYRADRAGLLVFAEIGNAMEYTPLAARRLRREWSDTVLATRSHPSIVCWVPINESWGVPGIAHDAEQAAFATAMATLTRHLDPTRPALSNDGWQHVDSDLLTLHDYTARAVVLRRRYRHKGVQRLRTRDQVGPAARFIVLGDEQRTQLPMLLDECGGVRFAPGAARRGGGWGYSSVRTARGFRRRLAAIMTAIRSSDALGGFCWTQLTDTAQEVNGLCDEQRRPKLDPEQLRAIFGPR
ncbi:Glycoside hydrolase [Propionibacterium freudenreichii]|uniref:glycoside hydrolase family 2 protein n=1 Tax=Propionibacterium freudenreichii TaxID=1744 RepID=UPI0005A5CC87|nr:glycoside hydrolase family 2 TIM barrel-domain containing protein [Propionibacterium freudenreichii]CEI22136.1 Glycoside hydrolase [Propionibacterium freudenreichii]